MTRITASDSPTVTNDIADPIGGPDRLYEQTASELEELLDRFVELAFAAADRDDRETA